MLSVLWRANVTNIDGARFYFEQVKSMGSCLPFLGGSRGWGGVGIQQAAVDTGDARSSSEYLPYIQVGSRQHNVVGPFLQRLPHCHPESLNFRL